LSRRRNFLRSLLAGLFGLLALGAKKVFDYSAAPNGEKESDFVFPPRASGEKAPAPAEGAPVALRFKERGGFTNDASHLNKTAVAGIIQAASEDDIRSALQFAGENHLKITSLGQQHSMGGQTFTTGGLLLDLKELNRVALDKAQKAVKVQAGVRWWQLQELLDGQGLAVKAMQSINIFSVGGTLSVNAHGIDPKPGPVAPTVRSLRVMLSSGDMVRASGVENAELFRHVLGGYGLFGVIVEADLDVVDDEFYGRELVYMDYREFPQYYRQNVEGNSQVGLTFARLSVAPQSYLHETAVHIYRKVPFEGAFPRLEPDQHETIERFIFNQSKTGGFGRWIRWTLEKHAEPRLRPCVTRNQAMNGKEVCLVSRGEEMYQGMGFLQNRLRDTDILQEYFVPYDRLPDFVDRLREVVVRNGANLLNVTIRTVHKDSVTALPYAKDDMFGLVLYFNVEFNIRDNLALQKTTVDLIDEARAVGGTFYLPYQLVYSPAQLRAAYPEVDQFFAAKKKYDPIELFSNQWYEKYAR
jgi:FAD/FMN-containing dehydrogenase